MAPAVIAAADFKTCRRDGNERERNALAKAGLQLMHKGPPHPYWMRSPAKRTTIATHSAFGNLMEADAAAEGKNMGIDLQFYGRW
jgi:hypothetical protein